MKNTLVAWENAHKMMLPRKKIKLLLLTIIIIKKLLQEHVPYDLWVMSRWAITILILCISLFSTTNTDSQGRKYSTEDSLKTQGFEKVVVSLIAVIGFCPYAENHIVVTSMWQTGLKEQAYTQILSHASLLRKL